VSLINGKEASAPSTLIKEPKVCESSGEWCGYAADRPIAEVWESVVENGKEKKGIGCDEVGKKHGGGMNRHDQAECCCGLVR